MFMESLKDLLSSWVKFFIFDEVRFTYATSRKYKLHLSLYFENSLVVNKIIVTNSLGWKGLAKKYEPSYYYQSKQDIRNAEEFKIKKYALSSPIGHYVYIQSIYLCCNNSNIIDKINKKL